MDLTREDTLFLLSTLGVTFPKEIRMEKNVLGKRLSRALDASQLFLTHFKSTTVKPTNFPLWKISRDSQTLKKALNRVNMLEACRNAGAENTPDLFRGMLHGNEVATYEEKLFLEVRQCLLAFGHYWIEGQQTFVLQDKGRASAIIIRIVEIFSVNDDCPLMVVLHKHLKNTNAESIHECVSRNFPSLKCAITVNASLPEQQMIGWVLAMNSKRLSSDYAVERRTIEESFKLSFLIPLLPLGLHDLGKLSNTTGCHLCGTRKTSFCVQCMTVSYCGRECQKLDWKEHKHTCRDLKGGTWRTITFKVNIPGMYKIFVNRFDLTNPCLDNVHGPNSEPGPNIHGDKVFLVKLQSSLNKDPSHPMYRNMMIYDRHKSFQGFMMEVDDVDAYREAEGAIKTGWKGIKMYRWARRVGEYQLSICFDKAPSQDPPW